MNNTPTPSTSKLKSVLFACLREAGRLILKSDARQKKVQFKGSQINLVTEVDKACDELIRKTILKTFPDHQLLTEESDPRHSASAYKWIVDPLDGTTNYAHHFPQVCVSIGLERNGQIVLAGVYDPYRDELFWAVKGKGAYLNRKQISVSNARTLQQSLLLTGFPYDRNTRSSFYMRFAQTFLEKSQDLRRQGAAALDLCWVACGRVDGYWEWRLKPWDSAAGSFIVTEAGGKMSDFSGKRFSHYGEQTLATNGKIHNEMLKTFRTLTA